MEYQEANRCAVRPNTVAEEKAKAWGLARYELDNAQQRAKEAQAVLEQATAIEANAWVELECEAGRAKPCPPPQPTGVKFSR